VEVDARGTSGAKRPPGARPARLRRTIVGLALVAAALGAGAGGLMLVLRAPGPPRTGPATVAVEEGESFAEIVDDLHRQGVLDHPLALRVWARLSGRDRNVHWGEYFVTTPLSPLELLARITGPPDPVHAVTLPEGRTLREVVALLAAGGFGSQESFLCLLDDPAFLASEDLPSTGAEGYLFPDTYNFPLAMPQDRILRTMIHRFAERTGPAFVVRAAAIGLSAHQAVTLASLVEEETARPEERRLVAAVFLNRLRRGMPLQSDPTVLYGRERHDRSLTHADLLRPTPYNTYTISGLPPAPIANPGRAALDAAVDPAAVDYLYFVARGDGTHEFSTTLAAHNTAVARYRRAVQGGAR
jgi:UPF0755 protein